MSSSNAFPDHFSGVASGYSTYRPTYPASLFDWLSTLAPTTGTVWDCAAGNGQASVPLGQRFGRVIASDASANQIVHADPHANVHYVVATGEACPLWGGSVSLVTVAQALHWFEFDTFFAEAKRVLVPGGVLVAWGYQLLRVDENARLEQLVDDFSERTLAAWWPAQRRHVDVGYADIPFPLQPIDVPAFEMTADWTLVQLAGYLRTWSSVSRKRLAEGVDPVALLEPELARAWGRAPVLRMRWPLCVLAGRTAR